MILLRKLKTFHSLPPGERDIFYRFLVLLPVVAWRVKFLSIKSTTDWLKSKLPPHVKRQQEDDAVLALARRTTWLMLKALRFSPVKGKCLSQSLVLWHLLSRQGITSQLRIGFKKDDSHLPVASDNFTAHAWVECQGVILNDHPDVYQRFVVFDEAMKPAGKP